MTAPGIAGVSRSSSSAAANASRRPDTKRQGTRRSGKCRGPQLLRSSGRVERIADENERGDLESLGDRHRAHPAAHRSAADRDASRRHTESIGQLRGGGSYRLDADLRRVRAAPSSRLAGKLDPFDDDAELRDDAVDLDERRVVAPRARAGVRTRPAGRVPMVRFAVVVRAGVMARWLARPARLWERCADYEVAGGGAAWRPSVDGHTK